MHYVVTSIGVLLIVLGTIFVANPLLMKRLIDVFKVGRRAYAGGVIRLALGALLIAAARQAAFPWIPGVIGALSVASGVAIFALGVARIHAMMEWWMALPDGRLRLVPLITVAMGILLVYSA